METGKKSCLEFISNVSWATVRVRYEEQYDVPSNTSDLTVTAIEVRSANWYGVTYYPDGVLTVNGTEVLRLNAERGDAIVTVSTQNDWYTLCHADGTPVTATLTGIVHDNSGEKTVEVALTGNRFSRFAFYTADGGYGSGWGVSQSRSLALTDIPRASPIAATDAAIGSVSTVTVTRRSAAYSHTVAFAFGELSGWLDADGSILTGEKRLTAATIPFAIPQSFYGQLTDASSGVCTLSCATYAGDTQIGYTQQTTFRVLAEASACAPAVTGTVIDVNPATLALTGDENILIRYASTALCAISAEGREGATIVQKTIGGEIVEGDSRTLENIESGTVLFTATDSRGYTAAVTVELPMVDYVPLTLNAAAKRTDPTSGEAVLTLRGNFYPGSFGAEGNTLDLTYTVGDQSGGIEPVIDGDTYTATAKLTDLDYRTSHTVSVTAADALYTTGCTVTVGKGIPVFDWGEGDFAFHVPVALEKGFTVQGKSLLDLTYPVGALYLGDADPTANLGGTWTTLENDLGLPIWKRTA